MRASRSRPLPSPGTWRDIPAPQRKQIRATAARLGIAICGIHWVLAQTEGLHLNHPDTAIRERTAAYLCDLVDFCADLGGQIIVVPVYALGNATCCPALLRLRRAWDWAARTTLPAHSVHRATARGVTLCLEPLSPAETDFINTAEAAIRFTQQFASPHFKIISSDGQGHVRRSPSRFRKLSANAWPHFAHFHANDQKPERPRFR